MNISDRLTPEERELARLLGRPAPSEQPGAYLDARIMAMANKPLPAPAATAPRSVRRSSSSWSRRRGVTSSLAVAASLVLVVGLAWQLRPTPPTAPHMDIASADSAVVPAAAPPVAEPVADAADAASTVTMPAAAPAEVAAVDDKASIENSAASRASANAAKARTAKAVEPQAHAAREAAVRAAPAYDAAPPIAPPSPPAPPAPAPAPAPAMAPQPSEQFGAQADKSAALVAETASRMAPPRPAPSAAPRLSRAAPQSVKNEQAERVQQQLLGDIESDAALSRRHWLKRIRERRDAGDLAGARLSLQRFVQGYPEAHIPRDLRPLLQD